MAAMIAAGKIRHYGLSNETAWGVCEFHRVAKELGVAGPVTIQNSYSLVSRNVDNDLAEVLFREGMSLLAYSPLAGGMLSGKYRNGAQPPASRFTLFDNLGLRFRKPMVRDAIDAYAALAARCGISLVQLALGYVRSRWFVSASIIGATTPSQLAEDVAGGAIRTRQPKRSPPSPRSRRGFRIRPVEPVAREASAAAAERAFEQRLVDAAQGGIATRVTV